MRLCRRVGISRASRVFTSRRHAGGRQLDARAEAAVASGSLPVARRASQHTVRVQVRALSLAHSRAGRRKAAAFCSIAPVRPTTDAQVQRARQRTAAADAWTAEVVVCSPSGSSRRRRRVQLLPLGGGGLLVVGPRLRQASGIRQRCAQHASAGGLRTCARRGAGTSAARVQLQRTSLTCASAARTRRKHARKHDAPRLCLRKAHRAA